MPTFKIIAFISSSHKDFTQFIRDHFSKNEDAILEADLKNGKYEVKYLNENTEVYIRISTEEDIRGRIFSDYIITENPDGFDFKQDVVNLVKLRMR